MAHRPAGAACRVDAEALRGTITGSGLPSPTAGQPAPHRWAGLVGADPTATVHLRVDDGSIRLDATP